MRCQRQVDEVIGVAGFVGPGTRVDVVVTLSGRAGGGESVTQVLLQNVPTLAAGALTQPDAQGKPQRVTVITLLVTPEQAEVLILAANEGRIQLALRNTLDLELLAPRGVRGASLLRAGRGLAGWPYGRGTAPQLHTRPCRDRGVQGRRSYSGKILTERIVCEHAELP
jgi:Flp pilus assembly protein CpaB